MRLWLRTERSQQNLVTKTASEKAGEDKLFFNANGSPRELSAYGAAMALLSSMMRHFDSLNGLPLTSIELDNTFSTKELEDLARQDSAHSVDNGSWNRQARTTGEGLIFVATHNDTGRRVITHMGLKEGRAQVISLRASLQEGNVGVADLHREGDTATIVAALSQPSGEWHTFYAVVGCSGVKDSFYYGSKDPHPDGAALFDMSAQGRRDELMRMAYLKKRQVVG